MGELAPSWSFEHVIPAVKEHAQRRGVSYNPEHPLDGMDEIGPGQMIKRAFEAIRPDYGAEKNLAADANVDRSTVSRWYGSDSPGYRVVADSIFPALCNAYVREFCNQGYEDTGDSRIYYKNSYPKYYPDPEDKSYYWHERDCLSVVEVELAATSLLLTGTEDRHITKSTAGLIRGGSYLPKERYQAAVLRLASTVLKGAMLDRLAGTAIDYLRLRKYEAEQLSSPGGDITGKRLARVGVSEHIELHMGMNDTSNPGDFDDWADIYEAGFMATAEPIDLIRLRDACEAELARRKELRKKAAAEYQETGVWPDWAED